MNIDLVTAQLNLQDTEFVRLEISPMNVSFLTNHKKANVKMDPLQ